MAGHRNTNVQSCLFLNLFCDLIGNRRIFIIRHFFLIFFLGKRSVLFGDRALGNGQDRKLAASLGTFVDGIHYFLDIIGNLRNQNDIRAACHTGVQCQETDFMSHHFHDKHTSVGCRRGMYTVDTVRSDIYRALETKGHICPPEVIVDGLRQRYDI